jgi:exonuclease SbcC
MRFEKLRLAGMGPFASEQELDLAQLGNARVVAVAGENGAGKSTLLELFAAALYRQCPTRGALQSLATTRNSYVEARVVNGAAYAVRQTCDAISGKGESFVIDEYGGSPVQSGKRRDFDAWTKRHLPSADVFFASQFAAQGSGGLLAMKPAERKAVILRALGIERIEALAALARERTRDASAAASAITALLDDADWRASKAPSIQIGLETARADAESLASLLTDIHGELERRRDLNAKRALVISRNLELQRQLAQLQDERARCVAEISDLQTRRDNNSTLLSQADDIREAARQSTELLELRAERERARGVANQHWHRARADMDRAKERVDDAHDNLRGCTDRSTAIARRLASLDETAIDAARAEIPALTTHIEQLRTDVEDRRADVDRVINQRIAGADERIGALRGALDEIVVDPDMAVTIASEALADDDAAVRTAQELPARTQAAYAALDAVSGSLRRAENSLTSARQIASRADELVQLRADYAVAREEVDRHQRRVDEALTQLELCRATIDEADSAAEAANAQLTETIASIDKLAPAVRRLPALDQAELRIAELDVSLEAARARLSRIELQIAGVPQRQDPGEDLDVAGAVESEQRTARELRAVELRIAAAEQRLAEATSAAERADALREQTRAAQQELADWTRLAADLGRDGIQALEIDAAGPEISQTANELLHSCFGSRFTVRLDTTRSSADGKRQLEDCEIAVIDTERGRDAPADTLSGGERVIVGEAISLALTVLACRRSGVERPTLIRDESGAALDSENGRAYVAMLRRAAEIIGADRVLFVSHSAELVELADATIEIVDGTIAVRSAI